MSNCQEVLSNYAGLLENNALDSSNDVIRPHPLFFTSKNCQGSTYPAQNEEPEYGKLIDNPNVSDAVQSMYIPSGYTVNFVTSKGTYTYKAIEPQIITDMSLFLIQVTIPLPVGGLPVSEQQDKVITRKYSVPDLKSYSLLPPMDEQGNYETLSSWKLSHCYKNRYSYVGNSVLNSFKPQSIECDAFMNSYCNPLLANLSCSLSSNAAILKDGIAPDLTHRENACSCKLEKKCQQNIFGVETAAKMPIVCTGKNCSLEGYKNKEDFEQPCNLTLCRQIVEVSGKNIVNSGSQTLYCGTKSHKLIVEKDEETNEVKNVEIEESVAPASENASSKPSHVNADRSIPTYLWIVMGFIVLMLIVLLPGVILMFRKQKNQQKQNSSGNSSS